MSLNTIQDNRLPVQDSLQSPLDRLRLRVTQLAVTALLLFIILSSVSVIGRGETIPPFVFIFVVVLGSVLVALFQRRYARPLSNLVILMVVFLTLVAQRGDAFVGLMLISLVIAPLFGNTPVYTFTLISILIKSISIDFIPALYGPLLLPDVENRLLFENVTLYTGTMAILSVLLRIFSVQIQRSAASSLQSARLLEASATIGQVMSQYLDKDELLRQSVAIIRDRFEAYHVQIFLVSDDRSVAALAASTGEIGEKLLARKHHVRLSLDNIIGRVVEASEPILIHRNDNHRMSDELQPGAVSELALPIIDGDRIIGILDVQTDRSNAFAETEIQALRVISGQLANAFRNARLFEEQEQTIRENKRLFFEAESNLREIQRLNRQLTRQSWDDYLYTNQRNVAGVMLDAEQFRPGGEWSEIMQRSRQRRRVEWEKHEDGQVIAVPVELRGEVIGVIEAETGPDTREEDFNDMMQTIASRLAISLDNARLFEETQEATAQEQYVSELVASYQTAGTVDDLLQLTLEGLYETLGAQSGSIRLVNMPEISGQAEEDESQAAPRNGQHTTD